MNQIKVSAMKNEITTDLRKGQWTAEEDSMLISSIAAHGEGRWDSLALLAGLRRTGKSCRLRWRNYLRPDLRRDNFTLVEQLHILQLHLHWGNRWSKIAKQLPGRTDNEVKNYWRTKVQKLARHFQCGVKSPQFREALCHIWIPRLIEQIHANNSTSHANGSGSNPNYCISNSENSCILDTTWAHVPVIGPHDSCATSGDPSTDSSVAHIAAACDSSDDWEWEQLINDLIWELD